jgi:prepilin signal peptidase PulO-like enzyme (type II secretory pathway)
MLLFPKKWGNPDESDQIPTWIGWGDLRIALFIGLTLGIIHGIASFAFAYVIGSIYAIGSILIRGRAALKSSNQLPFWPFLWLGWLLAVFFHGEILQYAEGVFDSVALIVKYISL